MSSWPQLPGSPSKATQNVLKKYVEARFKPHITYQEILISHFSKQKKTYFAPLNEQVFKRFVRKHKLKYEIITPKTVYTKTSSHIELFSSDVLTQSAARVDAPSRAV